MLPISIREVDVDVADCAIAQSALACDTNHALTTLYRSRTIRQRKREITHQERENGRKS